MASAWARAYIGVLEFLQGPGQSPWSVENRLFTAPRLSTAELLLRYFAVLSAFFVVVPMVMYAAFCQLLQ